MQNNFSPKATWLCLASIVGFSLLIVFLFYYTSHFYPLLSDTARFACGVRNLVQHKTLNTPTHYLNFSGIDGELCWTGKTYALIRIFGSFFAFLSPKISPWLSLYLFVLIVWALISCFIFLVTKNLFLNNKIALISTSFGAFAPFFARSLLVHPQNLVGFLFILIFILFFIKYQYKKNPKDQIVAIFIFALLPFLHHLSFFVLLLSLIFYFLITNKIQKIFCYLLICLFLTTFIYFFISHRPIEFVLNIINHSAEGGAFWESSIKKPFFEIPSYLGYLLFALGFWGMINLSFLAAQNKLRRFFVALFFAPALFSQIYLLGFNFFSFRIIAYAGLPLIILSGYGVIKLSELFKKFNLQKLFYFFALALFLANLGHFFAYLTHIYQTRNLEYLPQKNFLKTVDWLNQHSYQNTFILTTNAKKDKQTAGFAYLYKGNVIYYPATFFSNPKKLKFLDKTAQARLDPEYFKTQPKHFLPRLILKFNYFKKLREDAYFAAKKSFRKLQKLNQLLTNPEKYPTLNYEKHEISYVVLKVNSWADKIYQKQTKFKVVYQNPEWRIYQVKP